MLDATTSAPLRGIIVTPTGLVKGELRHSSGFIASVEGEAISESGLRAERGPLLLPGFVDLHVHGGGGRDVMESGSAIEVIARVHAGHGTTSFLATTMTAPLEDIERALAPTRSYQRSRPRGGAALLGVHLEGPYLSPKKLGSQPDCTRIASAREVLELASEAPIRVVTLAPEVPGHLELIAELTAAGLRVQIGHTVASYEDTVAALVRGASGFTHLFNAMSALHHRQPGVVGAALAHATYAELIPDLQHVHPGAMRAAMRAIPCLYCVTDSTGAAGMPDGEYQLGNQPIFKCMGGVRLADGTLAGSSLTMDQAFRNLVGLGLSLQDASIRVSTYAADYLGLTDRGRLQVGACADVVVMGMDLKLERVLVEGEEIVIADV